MFVTAGVKTMATKGLQAEVDSLYAYWLATVQTVQGMTAAATHGWAGLALPKPEASSGIATYRCTECTLMRCYVAGQSCWECAETAGSQVAAQTAVVCCNCGWLMTAGLVTCPGCGGSS